MQALRPLADIDAAIRRASATLDLLTAEKRETKKALRQRRRQPIKADYVSGMDRAEILVRHNITGSALSGLISRNGWKRTPQLVKLLSPRQFFHYNRLRPLMSRYAAVAAARQIDP